MLSDDSLMGERAVPGGTVRAASLSEIAFWFSMPLILAYAMLLAVPNAFLKDGFTYLAMVHSLVENGSLAFENGYESYGSPGQTLSFFIPVEGRLMPQYPSGWAFVAAPFYALGGVRGLFLLNALATILTIWLIRQTGRTLFEDDRVGIYAALLYAFATFALDYAGAVWPHALAVLCVTGAIAAAALGWRRDSVLWFAVAGLALGIGIHMRVDAVLAAGPIGLWALGAASRPYRTSAALVAGFLPGALAAAWINWLKFGIFFPITYGRSEAGGGTSLSTYADALPLVALLAAVAFSLGLDPVRRIVFRPAVLLGAAVALAAVVLAVPGLRAATLDAGKGFVALVVALELFPDTILGQHTIRSDGVVLIYTWAKKALLQSVPYAALALLALPALAGGPRRAPVVLLLLVFVACVAPFAAIGWYGGRANHMRYFLMVLPAVTLLAGLALRRLDEAPRGPVALALAAGIGVPLFAVLPALIAGREWLIVLQRDLPNLVVLATAVFALGFLVLEGAGRAAAASGLRGLAAAGVLTATVSCLGIDTIVHQGFRGLNYRLTEAIRPLPADAAFNTLFPTWAFERLGVPESLILSTPNGREYADPDLITRLLAEGRPVYVQTPGAVEALEKAGVVGRAEPAVPIDDPYIQLFRVWPPSS